MATLISSSAIWPSGSNKSGGRFGPYQDANGDLWYVGVGSGNILVIYHSADGGSTWGTFSSPGITPMDSVYDSVNNVIYLVAAVVPNPQIWKFDCAAQTFTRIDSATGIPTLGTDVNGAQKIFLARRSDGSFVVVYQGPTHTSMGSSFRSVFFATCTSGGTWGTATEADPGSTVSYSLSSAVLGASDRVHILYTTSAGQSGHVSLSSANVLDTAATVASFGEGSYGQLLYDATLAKVCMQSGSVVRRATSAANPTWTADTGSPGAINALIPGFAFYYDPVAAALKGVFQDTTDVKIETNSAPVTTWGTKVALETVSLQAVTVTTAGLVFYDVNGGIYFHSFVAAKVNQAGINATPLLIKLARDTGKFRKLHNSRLLWSSPAATYIDANIPTSITTVLGGEIRLTGIYKTVLDAKQPLSLTPPPEIDIRAKCGPTDIGQLNVSLYNGTTLIESWTVNLTTTFATYAHVLTNAAAIGDWTNLQLWIQGQSGAGSTLTAQISWVRLASSPGIQPPSSSGTKPLLMKLGDYVNEFHLLRGPLNTDQVAHAGIFSDSATISSATSVQSAESTDFLDSGGTVQGTSSVQSTETAQNVESATIGSVSSVSAAETTQYVDAATPASTTQPSSTEIAAYVDADTPSTVTQPSSVDVAAFVDSSTITSITSITADVQVTFDAARPKPLLITLERHGSLARLIGNNILNPDQSAHAVAYTDAAIISSTTSVQSSESTDFIDSGGTVQGTSSVTSTETAQDVDASTVVGITSPSATDVAADVDANTVTGTTTVSATEIEASVDSGTISSTTDPSGSTDIYAAVDSATLTSITSISDVQEHDIPDSGTVSGTTVVTSADTAQYVDAGTLISTTQPSATETTDYADSSSVAGSTFVSAIETAAYVDADTPASTTSLTSVDTIGAQDADTPMVVTQPSSADVAAYVDAGTVAGVTTVSSIEVVSGFIQQPSLHPLMIKLIRYRKMRLPNFKPAPAVLPKVFVDSDTPGTVTSVSAAEEHVISDINTVTSITDISGSVELYAAVDSNTVSTISSVSATEAEQGVDDSTLTTITQISYVDIAQYVDSAIVGGVNTPSGSEVTGNSGTDSATLGTVTTPFGLDEHDTPDSATVQGLTGITSSDIAAYIDSNVVNGTSYVFDSDISTFIDSSTLTSTTRISSIETSQTLDSATISGITSLDYIIVSDLTDSDTIVGQSYVVEADISQFIDGDTVSSVTTVIGEIPPLFFVELVGTAIQRWTVAFDKHYTATSTKHFTYQADTHYEAKGVSEFVTTE